MSKDSADTSESKRIKFLYSYAGRILPRRTDGKLRYVGGFTRVLAVYRSITFEELMERFRDLCGSSMSLKCKLPSEDLDVLVSIACDEDLANVIDEYDRFASATQKDVKITALLFPLKSLKKISPVSSAEDLHSTGSSGDASSTNSPTLAFAGFRSAPPHIAAYTCRCCGRNSLPGFAVPTGFRRDAGKVCYHACCEQGRRRHAYAVHPRNHFRSSRTPRYSTRFLS
ncbi:uncharacterized protein LOC127789849 [Diospyros lotus]|uniref:uncharacterized protein LOC127789849 n=1 Tax=Diospyros lotus TaxID=55363 RepID=UPI00225B5AEB|nr:uncharacterized protein LOC127789849 [Diospyros lotus]XP_052174841.1 uncharacterized protein LOC127789849 [Diospyros lotus]